jgi:hypothetical protein
MVAEDVAAAEVEAERTNCPSWPGATESVDGVAVTPAGRPLSEIFTGSAKPLTAAAVMVNVRAEPPLCRAMEFGAAVIVKSGTGAVEMEREAVAVWESEFAVAVTVTVADAGAAEFEAVSTN